MRRMSANCAPESAIYPTYDHSFSQPKFLSHQGDSGGPVVIYDESGEATQIGVVSFGRSQECSEGEPTGYARVEYYLDWISEKTGLTFN